MSVATNVIQHKDNQDFSAERIDLACAFRWTARLNMHEGVANHFSLAVNDDGSRFLINPNKRHFSRITASSLLVLDANDTSTMQQENAPDITAWGLHGAVHRLCPHARCAMHVHSTYATILASLADSNLPPIDQNSAMFYNRIAIDDQYGGLALEEEAERCCAKLSDSSTMVLVMGNHGIMVVGETVAQTFDRLYYFERSCETYIKALWTGQKLRLLSDEIAERTAQQLADYPDNDGHLNELRAILDQENADFRD